MSAAQTQSERALVAWAILGDTVKRADLYEGLFGFIRPLADARAGKRYIPSELVEALRENYGLNMPVLVMESLTERLQKAGLLAIHTQTKDATIFVYGQSPEAAPSRLTEQSIAGMLERFRNYIRGASTEFAQETNAVLDADFFERLMHVDSLALLSRRDSHEAPKRTANTLSLRRSELEKTDSGDGAASRAGEHVDYLFASFLLQVRDGDPKTFDLLCEIAGANLVAETLLTYRDPPKKGEALQDLAIYLDAPLCMDILGVNIGREDYGRELIRTLQASRIDICVFLHSVSEVERVLDARRMSYLQANPSGPGLHTVEPPIIRDRVRAIVGHVESTLVDQVGCRVVDAAASVSAAIRARVGPGEERAIREALLGWSNAEAREVDVATVCDLIRLRSVREVPTRLPAAGPTLATRNSVLKRTANQAWQGWLLQGGRASQDRLKRVAPLAISDRHLAGLIWITHGGSIGQVSRELLVANCSAATAARRDVVVRVHNALVTTSPEDAKLFEAVIMDQRAERALMDATFGDPQVVNDDNVLELLATIRRATAEEIAVEKDAEIQRITAERDRVTAALQEQSAELENARRGIELATTLEADKTRKATLAKQAIVRKCFEQACNVHKWAGALVGVVLTGIALIAQVTLPEIIKDASPESFVARFAKAWWVPLALFALPTLLGMYEMPDMVFGGIRRKFADWVFRLLIRWHGVVGAAATVQLDFKGKALSFPD